MATSPPSRGRANLLLFAGTPKSSGYVNGPADAAKFNKPVGLAITAEGNLYIGDSENYAIRRIAIE